ncbi:SAM-dependent methyltransferase [Ktedonosporobacter rubrisoli]|uniref:SAM-dependent methyltransferase n=1 Tax=Ktedonosporobacter rubrisoli TaxID=2509675 RepID=A0A4P6JWP4_KTERU|nr:methyltransferase [Ktedonosporobacter rubrisoli]QBD79802.1 SAM-dependent methyltransferase [Ktedonosporobacter rubrisoli]
MKNTTSGFDPHHKNKETSENTLAASDPQQVEDLLLKLMAFRGARALQVFAELGIADLLQEGPQSAAQLAQATGSHELSLYRVLRVAAAQGVMEEIEHQVFAQNEMSSYFLSAHPAGLRYQAMMLGASYDSGAALKLDECVRTGKSAIQKLYGSSIWEYLAGHPGESLVYNRAMTALSGLDTLPILQGYDFSTFRSLVDVAGGHGFFLFSLLKAYPALRGILFDRPQVISEASMEEDVADRCSLLAGDMFAEIPAGADAYFLKHIIHDWGDEACSVLLNKCREAMPKHSKLLIVEVIMPPTGARLLDTLFDLAMLIKQGEGAHERTRGNFSSS